MKKNDLIFITSIAAWSLLFWKQEPGINFFLMNIIVIAGLFLKDKTVLKNKSWLLAAAAALFSSFCVMLYGNDLSIFANLFSLLTVAAFAMNRGNSLLAVFFLGVCSEAVAMSYIIIDALQRRERAREESSTGKKTFRRVVIVIFALVIALLFFFMYRSSSVLFYDLTKNINFDFISFDWCVFTTIGAVLLYGFYYHHSIPPFSRWDAAHRLQLQQSENKTWSDKLMSMDSENFSGIVLLALLNGLLMVVNSLDFSFFFGNYSLPKDVTYSEYVHQGTGMLITSIVLAILIILFYFRGRMNFAPQNKWLKRLALLWIIQNALLLFTTMLRNNLYVNEYGLTYKRIGVYVYLLLTVIGLCTVGWKVLKKKTNAFLFRANAWLFFAVWIISCPVNWDGIIFRFNTAHAHVDDKVYLNSLSWSVLPDMVDYRKAHPFTTGEGEEEQKMYRNIFHFLAHERTLRHDNRWPSFVVVANSVYNDLLHQQQFGKSDKLDISYSDEKNICFFPGFSGITTFNATHDEIDSLGEISKYTRLRVLNLNGTKIKSLNGIENLSDLEELYVYGTSVTDFSPLSKLPHLKVLWYDDATIPISDMHAAFPRLEIRTDSYNYAGYR